MAVCPICQSEARELDKVGDADGFDCPKHGKFKVASTVFVLANADRERAGREQWEAAFEKATENARPGTWPLITTYDF
jgi:hypothetical protein